MRDEPRHFSELALVLGAERALLVADAGTQEERVERRETIAVTHAPPASGTQSISAITAM